MASLTILSIAYEESWRCSLEWHMCQTLGHQHTPVMQCNMLTLVMMNMPSPSIAHGHALLTSRCPVAWLQEYPVCYLSAVGTCGQLPSNHEIWSAPPPKILHVHFAFMCSDTFRPLLVCTFPGPVAGRHDRVAASMDHRGPVLHGLHAVQYGPREHEHCHSAHVQAVLVGFHHSRPRAVLILLVRFICHLLELTEGLPPWGGICTCCPVPFRGKLTKTCLPAARSASASIHLSMRVV